MNTDVFQDINLGVDILVPNEVQYVGVLNINCVSVLRSWTEGSRSYCFYSSPVIRKLWTFLVYFPNSLQRFQWHLTGNKYPTHPLR